LWNFKNKGNIMASLTLGTQRDLTNDMLIKGIIDSVVTVNQFYQALPFKGIEGNALAYNREKAGNDQMALVGTLNTGATSINKDQQQFTRESTELTTIIGDAQVNGLIQAVGSDYNDATAVQVAAKAKGVGRKYMDLLVNGNQQAVATGGSMPADIDTVISQGDLSTLAKRQAAGLTFNISNVTYTGAVTSGAAGAEVLTANGAAAYNVASAILHGYTGFDGLSALTPTAMNFSADAAINPTTSTLANSLMARLDRYIDRIHDKDGMVDYIMMNSGGVRKYTQALRSTSAAGYDDVMEVKNSSGGVMKVQSYRGIPIFRNDFIQGTSLSSVLGGDESGTETGNANLFIGTVDDGSFTHGICGLTAKNAAGMQVQKLGAREDVDADITRVKWYCGLAHFSELGLLKGNL
jgi:hypothetical protein